MISGNLRLLVATTATVDYVHLARLVSTLGTIGGALGATLETDEAVREAAYARRSVDRGAAGSTRRRVGARHLDAVDDDKERLR